jgi:3-deoxy-D-manno-octulosonic-acid transferase
MCLAQSQGDADRFAALGSPHVFNTGKLQVDVPAPPADPEKLEQLKAAVQGRPVVVAASTHPGEEEHVFEAQRQLERYFPSLITVLAPRHPDRGEGLGQLASNFGLRAALRSRSELPQASTEVYIADTLGELGLFYRLTPIVFMGGSFANMGGHNPVEAVKLGAATIHGPNVANWSEIYEALGAAGGARRAESGEALVKHIGGWLDDRTAQQRASAAARVVVDRLGGALDKTMAALEPYLLQLRLESGTVHA